MDGNGNDREVKVVKHDIDVLVDSSLQAQVQVQCPATDVLQRAGIFRPARVKTGEKKQKNKNKKESGNYARSQIHKPER